MACDLSASVRLDNAGSNYMIGILHPDRVIGSVRLGQVPEGF